MNFLLALIPPGLLIAYFIVNEVVRAARRIKGIPGPTGLPIVGNLHQVSISSGSVADYRSE